MEQATRNKSRTMRRMIPQHHPECSCPVGRSVSLRCLYMYLNSNIQTTFIDSDSEIFAQNNKQSTDQGRQTRAAGREIRDATATARRGCCHPLLWLYLYRIITTTTITVTNRLLFFTSSTEPAASNSNCPFS